MKQYKEILDKIKCPCGSGKYYKNCCKKKKYKFKYSNDNVIKEIPINEEIIDNIEKIRQTFLEYYGRLPDEGDVIFPFAPLHDKGILLKTMDIFRELGFPESYIYAYFKTDGLLPTETNQDFISEIDLNEFNFYCKEYDSLINSTTEQKESPKTNIIQFVSISNVFINEQLDYISTSIIASMYDCIQRHMDPHDTLKYSMDSEIDYCFFSILKTIKTLESINTLKESSLPECIYALGRSIFENYMFMCNINTTNLFEEKILPKVDNENYTFEKYPNGKINYNKVINNKTNQRNDLHINNHDLKKNLRYNADQEIYSIFYKTACQYVHVDVLSAKSYFSNHDPYDEINPTLIASLISNVLTVLLLAEICQNNNIKEQYMKDVLFLCNNLSKKLYQCLEIANCDSRHTNDIYKIFMERLKEQFQFQI